jgi:hypothetical protein
MTYRPTNDCDDIDLIYFRGVDADFILEKSEDQTKRQIAETHNLQLDSWIVAYLYKEEELRRTEQSILDKLSQGYHL